MSENYNCWYAFYGRALGVASWRTCFQWHVRQRYALRDLPDYSDAFYCLYTQIVSLDLLNDVPVVSSPSWPSKLVAPRAAYSLFYSLQMLFNLYFSPLRFKFVGTLSARRRNKSINQSYLFTLVGEIGSLDLEDMRALPEDFSVKSETTGQYSRAASIFRWFLRLVRFI